MGEDDTTFQFTVEDESSEAMKAIAREQDALKETTTQLADEWEKSHTKMDVVSKKTLNNYGTQAREVSKVQKELVFDSAILTQRWVEVGNEADVVSKKMDVVSASTDKAGRRSRVLSGFIRGDLSPSVRDLTSDVLDNTKLLNKFGITATSITQVLGVLGPVALVAGAAVVGWKIGKAIDGLLNLDFHLRNQVDTLQEVEAQNERSAEGLELLRRVNERYGLTLTSVAEAEKFAREEREKGIRVAKELADEVKKLAKAQQEAAIATAAAAKEQFDALDSFKAQSSVFADITGGELFPGLAQLKDFANQAPAINELLGSAGITDEQKDAIARGIAEAALAGNVDGFEQFSAQLPFVIGDADLRGLLADDLAQLSTDPRVKAAFDAIAHEAAVAQTDGLIAGMESTRVRDAAAQVGQVVGDAVGEATTIALQAAKVRARVTGITGGDITQAPEAVQALFELLRRQGVQAFSGGSSRRLGGGELAGLENLAAGGQLGEIRAALAVLQEERQAFRSGRIFGGNRSAATFARENVDLQIRFLQQLEALVSQLQDSFPPGDQTVNISDSSIAELTRTLFLTQRSGTFR